VQNLFMLKWKVVWYSKIYALIFFLSKMRTRGIWFPWIRVFKSIEMQTFGRMQLQPDKLSWHQEVNLLVLKETMAFLTHFNFFQSIILTCSPPYFILRLWLDHSHKYAIFKELKLFSIIYKIINIIQNCLTYIDCAGKLTVKTTIVLP
jgi:hypothetical protein